jgi:hexulose-6-phosphate isomerase
MGQAHIAQVVDALLRTQALAEATGVELHLETDLGPAEFARCLESLPSRSFKVTYDTGNSASLGYDPREEFACYGHRIGSVHIKDRMRGGRTVALGTGDTNFATVFEELSRVMYPGGFVLQTARGIAGQELEHARRDREFLVGWLDRRDLRSPTRHA